MTQNIAQQVNSFLNGNFMIRKCLTMDVLSLRALSRHIIASTGLKEGNFDAVMSAVRRYKRIEKTAGDSRLRKSLSKVTVKTRSSIADVRVGKNRKNVDSISKLNSMIDVEKGEIIRIIQAEQAITLIIDEKNLKAFDSLFSKSDVISFEKNLVELNLQFTGEAQNVKGIISLVSSSLNAEDINIVEIMSCAPELLILIQKKDLLKALNVVDSLSSGIV